MAKHSDIFNMFMNFFGFSLVKDVKVEVYFPCGYNTIRVRLTNKTEYVFRYTSINNWSLETIDSHLMKMAEKRKVMKQ